MTRYIVSLTCIGPDAEVLTAITKGFVNQLLQAGYDVEEHRIFMPPEPKPTTEAQG